MAKSKPDADRPVGSLGPFTPEQIARSLKTLARIAASSERKK